MVLMNAPLGAFVEQPMRIDLLVSPFSLDHVAGFHFYPTSHPPVPWRMSSPAVDVDVSNISSRTETKLDDV